MASYLVVSVGINLSKGEGGHIYEMYFWDPTLVSLSRSSTLKPFPQPLLQVAIQVIERIPFLNNNFFLVIPFRF
jgi:hypothetical protein